jgi:integrase
VLGYRRDAQAESRQGRIEKRAHLHGLRHTWSYEGHRERRVPVTVIQAQLGERLSATSIYLNHLAPEDVSAAGRADEWQPA